MPLIARLMSFAIRLESLSLSGNKITCVGAKTVADAIPFCHDLADLVLSDNKIADNGMNCIAAALSGKESLTHLDVSENKLSQSCIKVSSHLPFLHPPVTLSNINDTVCETELDYSPRRPQVKTRTN